LERSTRGLDVIIVNPGVVWPWFSRTEEAAYFKVAKGLRYYTLGKTGFVAVSDVVRMAVELMKSEIRNERFVSGPKHIL
jgi:hypothetical protein